MERWAKAQNKRNESTSKSIAPEPAGGGVGEGPIGRERKTVTQGGTRGINLLTRRAQEAGRTSETTGAFQIHSRKTRITQAPAP